MSTPNDTSNDTLDMLDQVQAGNPIPTESDDSDTPAPAMPALQGNSQAPNIGTTAPTMPDPQSPGSPEEQQADADSSAPVPRGGSGSMWENILMGALSGLAGQQQKGRSSVANGMIGGAKGVEAAQQQQVENSNQSAELQMKQQQLSSEDQMRQAQVANALVQHQILAKQFSDLTEPAQQKAIEQESAAAEAQDTTFGNPPVATFKNTHDAYDAATKDTQAAALAGNHFDRYIVLHRSDGTAGEYKMSNGTNTQPYTMKGADGSDINIPAGSMTAEQDVSARIGIAKNNADNDLKQQIADEKAKTAAALQAAKEAGKDTEPVVAYDPNAVNTDGTKGQNKVMTRAQAIQAGLTNNPNAIVYKADPSTINSTIGGFNDVQQKIDMVAAVANDPAKMSQVQPGLAAAMLEHGKGIEVGAFGTKIDTSRVNAELYKEDVSQANDATREFVTAYGAAHEAITQLPRLQTFGKSSRMTQQQMEAAQNMLPAPGDDSDMAQRKMVALQTTLNPLRKQLPSMPGAALNPTWMDQQKSQTPTAQPTQQKTAKPDGVYDPATQTVIAPQGA